jgi:methanogenic corrinoid protein MtbC1
MDIELKTLGEEGIRQFLLLQADAVNAVTERFYSTYGSVYECFGPLGRESCRQDLAFHLEFLCPVLEFGFLQPMLDYLCWLDSVLSSRMIPAEHLALSLDWLGEFFASHMKEPDGKVVAGALQATRTKFLNTGKATLVAPKPPKAWPETDAFETALLAGHQYEALNILNQFIDSGSSMVDFEMHVIQPSLYRIGEKWQTNQVSVAQEHLASTIVQSVMTMGLLRSPPPVMSNKKILLACVEDNHHGIGLRMVSDAFQLAGWDVQHLGTNVPTAVIIQHASEWKPDIVGLSVSFAHHLQTAKAVIARLKEQLGITRPAVMVGGLAINRFSQLAGVFGADADSKDAMSAIASAIRIVDGSIL